MHLSPALRVLARPTIIVPVLLAAALLIFAFKLGGLGSVLVRVQAIPIWVLAFALLCAAVYVGVKALQLRLMLGNLGLHPAWRSFALAFAVGELALTLPFGLFAQNWVLSASSRIRVARSSAATVVMILAELVVVLVLLLAVGVPGWPAVRPVCVLLLIVFAMLVFGILRFEHLVQRWVDKVKHDLLRRVLVQGIELLRGLKRLSSPRLLPLNVLLAVAYLAALTVGFWAVGRGMGLHTLGYWTAATIYAFSLAVILLGGGIFGQIGTVEVLGMVAARAWGISYTDGLALMLGFRLVWTGAIWLLSLPVVCLLWRTIPPQAEGLIAASLPKRSDEAPH